MRFSIFTPSHDLRYIDTPLNSLKAQSFRDFEWVILLNGPALKQRDSLEEKIKKADINYRFVDFFQVNNSIIGYLKNECCNAAEGEILVELDHDDALEPDCLRELDKAFSKSKVDFVYSSDFAIRIKDRKEEYFTPFNPQFGWKTETATIISDGEKKEVKYHPAFDPSPLSFSYIWYAPNHVRAWKTDFYHSIGGHDIGMDICDDHDLLCRTYINGNCERIKKPLYKYYFHENNTAYGEKNKKIQEKTMELHDQYIEPMVSKWCDLNKLKKIDLCSANNKPEGYTGIDKRKLNDDDIVFDLDKPSWPFEDGSVGVFRSQDAIEHMKDPVNTMKEIHRCLAPDGWVLIEVPNTDGRGAFQDPTHVSFWNSNSFWYYTRMQEAHFIGAPVRFQLNRVLDYFPTQFHETNRISYTKAQLVKLSDDLKIVPPNGRQI